MKKKLPKNPVPPPPKFEPLTPKIASEKKTPLWQKELSNLSFISSITVIFLIALIFFIGLKIYVDIGPIKNPWDLKFPLTTLPKSFNVIVDNPDNNVLVFDKTLLVTRKTGPRTSVLISTPDNDYVIISSSSGEFS